MPCNILLTSFTTWLPHHQTNSSDDLLQEISKLNLTFASLTFLRLLPVDIELASREVITNIHQVTPDVIICCGMAECRNYLSIESNATDGNEVLKTNIALEKLVDESKKIQISHDAGKFVCEGLYYSILKYIFDSKINTGCIFVHVPILTEDNLAAIVKDFVLVIQKIGAL